MSDAWLFLINYLWLKALHIVFFTCWFSGLFYLPRIFVNLTMAKEATGYNHLLVMATKLYRFITPLMFITLILGIWLLLQNPGLLNAGWLQIKIALVVILIIYHLVCGQYLKKFTQQKVTKGDRYFRWFNEFPVLILFSVVILATIKPF